MECLPHWETFCYLLDHYGSFALFGLLALGIIALPVPEETLMVFSGILIDQGHLRPISTLLAAYGGSMTGITVSYLLGRGLGTYLIHHHGNWLGLTQAKINKGHHFFHRYGKWALFFGYFVPGVRHFTGFIAGMSALEYPYFALFAYTGALLWVTLFISIGYFFGAYGIQYMQGLDIPDDYLILAAIVCVVGGLIAWRLLKKKI